MLVAPENGSLELDQHGFYKYTPHTPAESDLDQDVFVLAVSDPPGGTHLITGDTGTVSVPLTLQNLSGAHVTAAGSAECVNGKDCSDKDLAGADLSGQNLAGVKFVGTNLTFTNLTGATLVSADFTRAILTGTKLAD